MRVLVTGNLGYIGTVLTPLLAEQSYEVLGLDSGYFRECNFSPAQHNGVTRQVLTDIRDVAEEQIESVEAIVHLSALSNDPMGALNPRLTEEINTEATRRLALFAKRAGVSRFVFASSCSIYGQSDQAALTEESPLNPQTAYARSKVVTERLLAELADSEFSPTFLRNGTAFGLSPRVRLDLAVNSLAAWGVATGQVRLMSDGRAWRPMVHVEDICSAILATLNAPREAVHCQALNVGRESENYQIRTIAEMVASVVAGAEVTFGQGASADTRTYNVSFQKIRRVLPGFAPAWTVAEGVRQLVAALSGAGLKQEDIEGRRYVRLNQLQHLIRTEQLDEQLRWRIPPRP